MSNQRDQTFLTREMAEQREQLRKLTAVFTATALVSDKQLLAHCSELGLLDRVQSLGKLQGCLHVRFASLDQLEMAVKGGKFTRL